MLHGTRRFVPALAILGTSALAFAAETSTEDLKAQIDALQRKVDALEAKQVSAADVDSTVRQVLEDSQRRSQLMAAEGFTAGYTNGKFLIQSADGSFVLNPNFQFQGRYIGNFRENSVQPTGATPSNSTGKASNDSSYDDGFEIRRMKFGFAGNAFTKDLTYSFRWATNRSSGVPELEDGWVRYRFAPEWSVYGGQFNTPISHSNLTSSSRSLAVDESLVDTLLVRQNYDYTQGVGIAWETQPARAQIAYHDGGGIGSGAANLNNGTVSKNTKFTDTAGEWGLAARGELKLLGGNWSQYDAFSAYGAKDDLLVVGIGGNVSGVSTVGGTGAGNGANVYTTAADVQWQPQAVKGLSVYAAAIDQEVAIRPAAEDAVVSNSTNNYGFVGQAGYLITPKFEVFGRYDILFLDTANFTTDQYDGLRNHLQEITAGVNYYLNGHAAKVTADVVYLPDGLPNGIIGSGVDSLGYLPTDGNSDEVVFRLQFQLLL